MALGLSGVLTNDVSGIVHAGGKLAIAAASLENYGSADPSLPRGEISAQFLTIAAGDIANAGKLLAAKDLTINSTGTVVNALGTIQAGGTVLVPAAGNLGEHLGPDPGRRCHRQCADHRQCDAGGPQRPAYHPGAVR